MFKSPLHPKALCLTEMTQGLHVIWFNVAFGVQGEYIVVSCSPTSPAKVFLWNIEKESMREFPASDLGLEPYSSGCWNGRYFVIRHHERDLLPNADPLLDEGPPVIDYPMAVGYSSGAMALHVWADDRTDRRHRDPYLF
jgi:hypothetical protein